MITFRRIPVLVASAAAALAISFSTAVSAADLSGAPKAVEAQPVRTAMPLPKARPSIVRKRVAVRYRTRLLAPRPWIVRPAYLPPAPVARVAVAWPLMLGIGF
jgi:hypothetical protein